jgi:FkbM family methyltransferase
MQHLHDVLAEVLLRYCPVEIVDIGANPLAQAAPYSPLLERGLAHVIGFEPHKEAFAALSAKNDSHADYLNVGVGDGQAHDFHIYSGVGLSSIFPLRQANIDTLELSATDLVEKTKIETVRLDDIAEIERIDFLKIDTQGSELMIFQNGQEKLSKTLAIQTELRFLQLYDGEPTMGQVLDHLVQSGFEFHRLVGINNFMLRDTRRPGFGRWMRQQTGDADGFFVRQLTALDKYTEAELARLSLIAGCALNLQNLTLFCLRKLVERGAIPASAEDAYADAVLAERRG